MYLITDLSACSLVSLKFSKIWSIIVFILFWKNLMQLMNINLVLEKNIQQVTLLLVTISSSRS